MIPAAGNLASGLAFLRTRLRRVRLSLELLLGRRIALFLAVDGFILFSVLIDSLIGGEGPDGMYISVVVIPLFLIGIPALSDAVALERRAGSLDLALCSPSGRGYFLRRIAAFSSVMLVQGGAIMLITWFTSERPFPIPYVILQIVLLCALIGSAVLFWALRLKTAGAVAVATTTTLLALSKWVFYKPIPEDPWASGAGWYTLPLDLTLDFARNSAVLLATTFLLHLYSRRRLDRPETLLS